jgi:dTDP-glucose 4,6-dehydratase
VPLYGSGINERDWLYVDDHCAALHLLVDDAAPGEVYNIGSGAQVTNLELTQAILKHLGMDESWIEFVPDRLGHDLRYALDSSKTRALGWGPNHDFATGIAATIDWYRERRDWWEPLEEMTP